MSIKTFSTDLAKHAEGDGFRSSNLPVTHDSKLGYLFSLLIAVLTAVASIAGLLYPNDIYPTAELRQSFVANDVVNLLIGLPILLGSMWLARHGILIGLLFWPGAIFYRLYNYVVYLFGMPLNVMFPLYLTITTLSIYTTIGLVATIEGQAVKQRLSGRVPERFAGAVLTGFGILFMLRAIGVMVGALNSQTPVARPELVFFPLIMRLRAPPWAWVPAALSPKRSAHCRSGSNWWIGRPHADRPGRRAARLTRPGSYLRHRGDKDHFKSMFFSTFFLR
jgi:hypothetical protein